MRKERSGGGEGWLKPEPNTWDREGIRVDGEAAANAPNLPDLEGREEWQIDTDV